MSRLASLLHRWPGFRHHHAVDESATAEQLLQTLFVLAWMVEARDPYTGGHLWRVSQYCRLLAQHAGLPDNATAQIAIGGFLHDLGKIGVPDAILNKPERLTNDEYAVIKTHPEVGARLLTGHPLSPLAYSAVLNHHERPDGSGYPACLSGDSIPLDARIVAICDTFDALTSARPYHHPLEVAQSLDIIEEDIDRHFDHHFAEHFLDLGHEGILQAVVGHSDHGIPMQECPVCGPTIVIRRIQHSGEHVYCRNCGNEAELSEVDGQLHAIPTGRKGKLTNLVAVPDLDVIGELVKASKAVLADSSFESPSAKDLIHH